MPDSVHALILLEISNSLFVEGGVEVLGWTGCLLFDVQATLSYHLEQSKRVQW